MTDSDLSMRPPAEGKRDRLVAAAGRMLYEQGVEATTLADIAQAAGIPVGNIYYYFKAKNDIISAVIDAQVSDIRGQLGMIEASCQEPGERLKALFSALAGQRDLIARFGCPHGSLYQELGKHAASAANVSGEPGAGGPDASRPIKLSIDWVERQFAAMGRPDARDLAIQTIAAYQGAALLTSVLRDPQLLERESRRMADWIDSLS
jgi:TetR/AcrR family transcriptional regulator, transcriptional repressor for nem operon